MYDPELKYCPKCSDEYMMAAEYCAACNILLLTGLEMVELQKGSGGRLARKGALTEDDDVVTVYKGSLIDVKHLQSLCEKENIGVAIVSPAGGCGSG